MIDAVESKCYDLDEDFEQIQREFQEHMVTYHGDEKQEDSSPKEKRFKKGPKIALADRIN